MRAKLLLLQRNIIKFNGKEIWDLPGGRIQKKESLEEALKREVITSCPLELTEKVAQL